MRFIVDIDNTIFETKNSDYANSKPILDRINKLNKLYDAGHEIIYWTGRGATTGIDWHAFTLVQLNDAGVKYTQLKTNKPHYDVWVDDKAFSAHSFFTN